LKEVQAVSHAAEQERESVDSKKMKPTGHGRFPRGPDEDETGKKVADDYDGVENPAGRAGGRIKDVGYGFDQGEEEPKQPEVSLLLAMTATQQQQNDDQESQGQQIREKGKVHKDPCFRLRAGFVW